LDVGLREVARIFFEKSQREEKPVARSGRPQLAGYLIGGDGDGAGAVGTGALGLFCAV